MTFRFLPSRLAGPSASTVVRRLLGSAVVCSLAITSILAVPAGAAAPTTTTTRAKTTTKSALPSKFLNVVAHGTVTAVQGWATAGGDSYSDPAQWALVLQNTSTHLAALDVQLTIELYGPNSQVSASPDTFAVTGIPAGNKFYLAGNWPYANAALSNVASMSVTISVGRTYAGRFMLPPVQMVIKQGRIVAQAYGAITNPYLGSTAPNTDDTLNVIYFNGHSQIMGIGSQSVLIPPPGKTNHFVMSIVPPAGTAAAKASMDPCDTTIDGLPAQCVALQ